MARPSNQEAFDRALGYFNEAKVKHGDFVNQVEKNYKAYRGILDHVSDAAQWTSKAHPPYIQHIVETTLASLVDDKLRFKIRPRLTLDELTDPNAAETKREGAKAHQILFDWQVRKSKFNQIQRPFVLQNAIAGLTVAKTYWVTERERRRSVIWEDTPLLDGNDQPILQALDGSMLTVPSPTEKVSPVITYDGPVTEVRDVRDFLWHESAVSLDKARYVIDRVWVSWEDIEDGFQAGQFGPDRGGWSLDQVKKAVGERKEVKDDYQNREQELWKQDRTKDLCEIIEVWDQVRHEATTIVNRSALLSHKPFPFFHERSPFVVCSTQPDLFRIPGVSQVEKIEHLQELLWTIMNQRVDNLQLINNAIFWFRPDLEDPDQYVFEPGARWPVEDPTQVEMWQPNVIPAEVSLGAEALIKGDLQNLAGGFPFSSGTDSQNVDQQTATGASIITNIAQKSIDTAKQQVYIAWGDVGHQRMVLNQQFIREPQIAPVLGVDNEEQLHVIEPQLLSGDFDFEIEAVPDALMRQEEQASAQALIQLATALAPILAQLSQGGAARMLNMDAFVEDLLRSFGKDDPERYFISQAPPAAPDQTGTPATPGASGGDQALGITGPGSIDPAVSPSAPVSNSPATLMARAQALAKGGGRNI